MDVLTINRGMHMNDTKHQTMRDHAIRVAVRYGYLTKEQAEEYQFKGSLQSGERTNYYFSHVDGQALVVSE